MRLVAVVPVKGLEQAKSRLGEALDPEERVELAAYLLRRTLMIIAAAHVAERVVVVSPDRAALAIAREWGAAARRQRHGELNEALALGRDWAQAHHADALLALPADLPLLCPEDLAALRDMSIRYSVVIAPDQAGSGTNALLLRPPTAIPFHFGPDSYRRHREAAAAASLAVYIYRSPRTERDLDTPPDMEAIGFVGTTGQGICTSDPGEC